MEISFLDTRSHYIPDGKFWVFATDEKGRVVGTVSIRHYDTRDFNEKPSAWISDFFVREDSRRKGVGIQLLLNIEQTAYHSCPEDVRMMAGVSASNTASRKAFERMGFREVGGFLSPDGMPVVVYAKDIA